jgi:hypothetical protein
LVYWVWNEKTDLLKKVVELNPFSSEYFYWIDMGSLRPAANTVKIHTASAEQNGCVFVSEV